MENKKEAISNKILEVLDDLESKGWNYPSFFEKTVGNSDLSLKSLEKIWQFLESIKRIPYSYKTEVEILKKMKGDPQNWKEFVEFDEQKAISQITDLIYELESLETFEADELITIFFSKRDNLQETLPFFIESLSFLKTLDVNLKELVLNILRKNHPSDWMKVLKQEINDSKAKKKQSLQIKENIVVQNVLNSEVLKNESSKLKTSGFTEIYSVFLDLESKNILTFEELNDLVRDKSQDMNRIIPFLREVFYIIEIHCPEKTMSPDSKETILNLLRKNKVEDWKGLILQFYEENYRSNFLPNKNPNQNNKSPLKDQMKQFNDKLIGNNQNMQNSQKCERKSLGSPKKNLTQKKTDINDISKVYSIFSDMESKGIFTVEQLEELVTAKNQEMSQMLPFIQETFNLFEKGLSLHLKENILNMLMKNKPEDWKKSVSHLLEEKKKLNDGEKQKFHGDEADEKKEKFRSFQLTSKDQDKFLIDLKKDQGRKKSQNEVVKTTQNFENVIVQEKNQKEKIKKNNDLTEVYSIFTEMELKNCFTFDELNDLLINKSQNIGLIIPFIKETFSLFKKELSKEFKAKILKTLRENEPKNWIRLIQKMLEKYQKIEAPLKQNEITNQKFDKNIQALVKVDPKKPKKTEGKTRSNDDVLNLIHKQNCTFSPLELREITLKILQINKANNMNKKEILQFSRDNKAFSELSEQISVVCRAIYLWKGYWPRTTQIVSVLMLILNKSQGILAEIKTGEGKSLIVAMTAVLTVWMGEKPDIVTSSPVLAMRDSIEFSYFYDFFDIKCTHNILTENNKEKEKIYDKDLVYGTAESFEGDILQQEFYGQDTRGIRKFGTVIIDEVDSMLLDGMHHCTYLSSEIPLLQEITYIFLIIWKRLCVLDQNDIHEILTNEDIMNDLTNNIIEKIIKGNINEKDMNSHSIETKEFILQNIHVWVANALKAYSYQENVEYVVETDSIKIVNQETGVVLEKTVWQNGLHQFLQLKHDKFVDSESLMTNWLSNITFFRKYAKLMGMTGTLGSSHCHNLLTEVYKVALAEIPTFKEKLLVKEEPLLVYSQKEWLLAIKNEIEEKLEIGRSILIINESISVVESLHAFLRNMNAKIIIYDRSDNEMQKQRLFSKEIGPNTIILSTNLAGRGTDINTSDELDKNGGLHILITHLPSNSRVEEQAIGRTARNGKPGSAKLIIESQSIANQFGNALSPQDLSLVRETIEKIVWEDKKVLIHRYEKKDALFKEHLDFLNSRFKDKSSWEETPLFDEVNKRWGFFCRELDQIDPEQYSLMYSVLREKMIKDLFSGEKHYTDNHSFNLQAIVDIQKNKPEEAMKSALKALEKQSGDVIAKSLLAFSLINQGEKENSARLFSEVIAETNTVIQKSNVPKALKSLFKTESLMSQKIMDRTLMAQKMDDVMGRKIENFHRAEEKKIMEINADAVPALRMRPLEVKEFDEKARNESLLQKSMVLQKNSQEVSLQSSVNEEFKQICEQCLKLLNERKPFKINLNHPIEERFPGCKNKKELSQLKAKIPFAPTIDIKQESSWGQYLLIFALGVGQIALGTCLTYSGLGAGLGIHMIAEGVSDIFYGLCCYYYGEDIEWKEYGMKKLVSYSLNLVLAVCDGSVSLDKLRQGYTNMKNIGKAGPGFFATLRANAKTALQNNSVIKKLEIVQIQKNQMGHVRKGANALDHNFMDLNKNAEAMKKMFVENGIKEGKAIMETKPFYQNVRQIMRNFEHFEKDFEKLLPMELNKMVFENKKVKYLVEKVALSNMEETEKEKYLSDLSKQVQENLPKLFSKNCSKLDFNSKLSSKGINLDYLSSDNPNKYEEFKSKIVMFYKEALDASINELIIGHSNSENLTFALHCIASFLENSHAKIEKLQKEGKNKNLKYEKHLEEFNKQIDEQAELSDLIDRTYLVSSKNQLIEKYNSKSNALKLEKEKIEIERKSIQSEFTNINELVKYHNNFQEKTDEHQKNFQEIYDALLKNKMISENKKLMVSENKMEKDIGKLLSNKSGFSGNEIDFAIQAIMTTLKNINDVNSNFNHKKNQESEKLTNVIQKSLEKSPREFLEKISAIYEDSIKSSL